MRAQLLAGRYPASREALLFYTAIAALQGRLAAALPPNPAAGRGFALDLLLPGRQPLTDLVREKGPEKLREQALGYDESVCRDSLRAYFTGEDVTSPRSFFARVLLQPAMFTWAAPEQEGERSSNRASDEGMKDGPRAASDSEGAVRESPALENITQRQAAELLAGIPLAEEPPRPTARCPRCDHAPQAGCLRPQGDGMALTLVCSLCIHEWLYPRVRCPACGSGDHHKLSFYTTAEFAHIEVQVCDSCQAYLHLVDLAKETQAIADVDELAALPLDVWAIERGYRKVHPNLAGI